MARKRVPNPQGRGRSAEGSAVLAREKKKRHPATRVRITGSERKEVQRIIAERPGQKLRPPAVYTSGPLKGYELPPQYQSSRRDDRPFWERRDVTRDVAEAFFGETAKLIGSQVPVAPTGRRKPEVDKLTLGLEIGSLFTGPLKVGGGLIKGGKAALTGKSVKEVAEAAKAGHKAPVKEATTKVRESLGPARARRAAQEGLYREERARRVKAAEAAQAAAGGGFRGYKASKAELRGELPKVRFEHLRQGNLSEGEFEEILRTVQDHPELSWWDKLHAQTAIANAFESGVTPQKAQIELLRQVFGDDAADTLANPSRWKKAGEVATDLVNVPRSLMASVDVSAPFRQGIVYGAASPRQFFRNFRPMYKALGSEKAAQGVTDYIHAHPRFELAERAGVQFTELKGRTSKFREEQFSSQYAEKIPGAGRVVRASGRAYQSFLNKARMDFFSELVETAQKAGHNVEDMRQLRSIAALVNAATGRGGLGRFESWGPALNGIFFAPRLIASRVNLLNPVWYAKQSKFVRLEALRSMSRMAGGAALALTLAKWAGASVSLDPRNADFAKIRVGNTRVDVLGGFQQYVRLLAQVQSGTIISSTTGETLTLGPGFGEMSRKDIILRFLEGKYSPPVSFIDDFFDGTDFSGEPFEVKKATLQRLIPLVLQDAYEFYSQTGSFPAAALMYGVAAHGIGTQTYADKSKQKQASEFKEWKQTAESAWKKANPETPNLPLLIVRAKRDKDATEQIVEDTEGEKERFEAVLGYLMEVHPELRQYESAYAQFLATGTPEQFERALGSLRYEVYGKTLENFNRIVPDD